MKLVVLMALVACDSATTAKYQGPALATVRGRMTVQGELTLSKPVKLAMVWFRANTLAEHVAGAPALVASGDIAYSGNFPQDFTFQLFDVPPAGTIKSNETVSYAEGFFVAYEDVNGNGALDIGGSSLIDHVLGATMSPLRWNSAGPQYATETEAIVVYLSAPHEAFPAGFSIVRGAQAEPISIDESRLEIELRDDASLDLLICEDYYHQKVGPTLCGVPYIEAPTLVGSIAPTGGYFLVQEGGRIFSAPGAQVWLNDVKLTSYQDTGTIPPTEVFSPKPADIRAGQNTVRVELAGYPMREHQVWVPQPVVLQGALDGQRVDAGTQVTVSWQADTRVSSEHFHVQALDSLSAVAVTGDRNGSTFVMPDEDGGVRLSLSLNSHSQTASVTGNRTVEVYLLPTR